MDFCSCRKVSLKSKIKFIDLHKSGMSIAAISKTHNISQSNMRYWISIEKKLRKEFEITNDINYFENTISTSDDILKYDMIINRVENIASIRKKGKIDLIDKIKSLDLLNDLQSLSLVAKETGYSKQLIYQWKKNESYLRQSYESRPRRRANKTFVRNDDTHCEDNNHEVDKSLSNNNSKDEKKLEFKVKKLKRQMNVLDMFDKGICVNDIAKLFDLKPVTILYWTSNSIKLRTKFAELDRYLKSKNGSISELETKFTKLKHKEKLECHRISLETRLSCLKFHNLMDMCSFDVLAEIFNYNRHTLRHWRLNIHESLSKYQLRQLWRKERLDKLLINIDHKLEIKKLYKLYKSDSVLNILDSFLTYGITFKCRQFTLRKYNVSCRQGKVKNVLRPYIQKRDNLIASTISSELQSLFETLYRDEYQVLYTINERFLLLFDQAQISDKSRNSIINEEITNLRSHVLKSLEKLISLHHMMVVP